MNGCPGCARWPGHCSSGACAANELPAAGSVREGFISGRLALVDAVVTLAASPALRREVAAAARERVLERFDIDRVGARYLSLNKELL